MDCRKRSFQARYNRRLAAEQGDVEAQNRLGGLYHEGRGVAQDYAEAVKWLRLAAEQGLAVAQYGLAVMYRDGEGVAQDHAAEVKWLRLAAEQGFPQAQHNLGVSYFLGRSVPQDYVAAHKWFNLAAVQEELAEPATRPSAAKLRGVVANLMTRDQIAEAQKLAREWMAKHQRN